MNRIFPNPKKWHEVYQHLVRYSKRHNISPPPKALILSGWGFTNDIEKKNRWEETFKWATDNNCAEIVNGILESDFYFVDIPTTYTVGPMGGPMYRPWDYEIKDRPSPESLAQYTHNLMRQELGINATGQRYSFGYSACPELDLQQPLFKLLQATEIGIQLSSSMEMVPELSVSAMVVHHPEAHYFAV